MTSKTILITGASRGIGAAIARAAAERQYQVVVNFNRSEAAAQEVVADIQAAGGTAIAIQADVGCQQSVQQMFRKIDDVFGPLSVLVNNAGILSNFRVEEVTPELLDEIFHSNVYSAYYCSREAITRMALDKGGQGGAIINLSSVASRLGGLPGGSSYAASKGAIDSFTLALAKEVGQRGIRVNAVRPGLIETDIHDLHGGLGQLRTLASTAVPLARSGSASEVANAVLWLATPEASYVHGTCLDVAGGR